MYRSLYRRDFLTDRTLFQVHITRIEVSFTMRSFLAILPFVLPTHTSASPSPSLSTRFPRYVPPSVRPYIREYPSQLTSTPDPSIPKYIHSLSSGWASFAVEHGSYGLHYQTHLILSPKEHWITVWTDSRETWPQAPVKGWRFTYSTERPGDMEVEVNNRKGGMDGVTLTWDWIWRYGKLRYLPVMLTKTPQGNLKIGKYEKTKIPALKGVQEAGDFLMRYNNKDWDIPHPDTCKVRIVYQEGKWFSKESVEIEIDWRTRSFRPMVEQCEFGEWLLMREAGDQNGWVRVVPRLLKGGGHDVVFLDVDGATMKECNEQVEVTEVVDKDVTPDPEFAAV